MEKKSVNNLAEKKFFNKPTTKVTPEQFLEWQKNMPS